MKLPSFKRIVKNDYKQDFQDLIETLAYSLNNAIEVIFDALNSKLSLGDNLYCDVSVIEVVVDSEGTPTTGTSYKLTKVKTKPLGVQVVNSLNLTDTTTYPTSGINISFTGENGGVSINNITGLQSGNRYRLTVITWG